MSDSVPAEYLDLLDRCLTIIHDLPTGLEPAGQSMETTMRQHRIREWRKAVMKAARRRGILE